MDCREFQEGLDLRFPSLELSDSEKLHVERCISCQHHLHRMKTMVGVPGKEEEFYLGDSEVEQLIAAVNGRIDQSVPKERVDNFRMGRILRLVAAVVLIVSVSLISLFVSDDPGDRSLDDEFDNDSFYTLLDDPNNAQLDDKTIEILLDDFTSDHATNASELLLDDLTEEEFNYLMDNYDVRELL